MVCAEEEEPAGYHVYETHQDEVSDTWYGIARGDHLQAAVAKLTQSGWGTVNYWTGRAYNAGVARVSTDDYKITRDKHYRVKGVHSVFEGDIVETTTTCTDALYFD